MTDPIDTPHLPQPGNDAGAAPGVVEQPAPPPPPVKKATPRPKKVKPKSAPSPDDLVWVVSRAAGLHRVPAAEAAAVVKRPGGRLATDRDLEIGGVGEA